MVSIAIPLICSQSPPHNCAGPPRRTWLWDLIVIFRFMCSHRSACAPPAAAHPHVWATVRSEIVFGPDHRSPASVTPGPSTSSIPPWRFRASIPTATASSRRGVEPLAKVNVELLKEFDYFTFVHLGDGEKSCRSRSRSTIRSTTTRPCSRCTSRCRSRSRSTPTIQTVAVDVYDPSFFVAFGFATDAPVKFSGDAPGLRGGDPEA